MSMRYYAAMFWAFVFGALIWVLFSKRRPPALRVSASGTTTLTSAEAMRQLFRHYSRVPRAWRPWELRARTEGARWLLVVYDDYDFESFPVHVFPADTLSETVSRYQSGTCHVIAAFDLGAQP